jgi:drug/metabolite transporter (DMT)-like permease
MLGVVILTSPSSIFGSIDTTDILQDYPYYKYGVLIALVGSCSSAFAYLMMRKIGPQIDSAINPLYFGIFISIASMFATPPFGHALPQLEWPTIGLLAVFCFFGWAAQVGVSKAVQLEKGGRVAAVLYVQVVMAFAFDVLVYNAKIKWTNVLGTVCVIGFTLSASVYKALH